MFQYLNEMVINRFVNHLDYQLKTVLHEVESSAYWQKFIAESTSDEFRLQTMKWIMREIWKYQLEVNRSVFTAVGRLGTSIEEQGLIRAMISVQIEEVGHGTIALNDFQKLGGSKDEADLLPSPPSTALISVVRHLGENYNPLCHLGYMYFFEMFTVMITEIVSPILERSNYPNDSLQFMKLHAQEDERHSNMLSDVILEVTERFADAEMQIQYGFDCFREVYPHRLWEFALNKAEHMILSD